ncbi:PREDICTED: subtilisin-like protease SBT1.9 [Tarenaya hassleriana]|uniref:subtilisin-like protease SBT1.9 n=1 Tax=Tarenaya hassleriana TaxID=28532 RepID=UPI00053C888A|nr:PREDICTED: subtilisin-like protease SBT1.9 [Tarenaya hassleriana]
MGTSDFERHPLCLFFFLVFICPFSRAEDDDVYIVHMDLSEMPKAFSSQHSWYMSTLASISSASDHLYTYNRVLRGFSAVLSPSGLRSLETSPGFVYATRDKPVKLDTTHSFEFLGLSPGSGAWAITDFGKGVIIGVVDSGLWPESKSFAEDGMGTIPSKWKGECEEGTQFNSSLCNKKLIGARSFSRGLVAHVPNVTISMNSTRDTEGHGTHTSSTAAGNFVEDVSFFGYASGTARGMAPRAHVAMYKVGFAEGTYQSDIIAAVDKAVEDGCDVISLSLGLTGAALYDDPVAIATFGAVREGVFVSTSAGNEGPFDGTLHNGTPWVLTVAAGTVDREFHATLDLENGVSVTGQSMYIGDFLYSDKFIPIVLLEYCNNSKLINATAKSKIVVCESMDDSLSRQVFSVRDSNVAGAVFISNATNTIRFFVQSPFPAIFLGPQEGYKLKNSIKNPETAPRARMEFKKTVLGTKPAPRIASYSSRGPSPSCPHVLKPDITAPGDLILAAWPDKISVNDDDDPPGNLFSKFNMISGTSMACPHAAGVAALVRAAHPDWSPEAIRSAIMTSSDATDNSGNPIGDLGSDDNGDNFLPATPLAMGAGHINPNRALKPGLVYDATTQDYINLMCAMNLTPKQINVVTGSSSPDCSSPSLDLNYPSFIAFFDGNNTKKTEDSSVEKVFKRTVTNVGEGAARYEAKVTAIEGFKVEVKPEKLVFAEKKEKKSFEVRIEGPRFMEVDKLFGFLIWEDEEGKYMVRSPIVVTRLSPDLLEN